ALGRGHQHRLANWSGRRDGCPGRRKHPVPPTTQARQGRRGASGGVDPGIRGRAREPIHGSGARLRRHGHPTVTHPKLCGEGASDAEDKAADASAEEAREHSAVTEETSDGERRPVLRIVRGNPTPDDIAALTVVLIAAARSKAEPETTTAGSWATPAGRL